ncbi:hypothetical protein [Leifsonia sp. LS-T14]|uniref:hypothetical protein n=1 Tax=unclassified Leifsonia TaxID=2663824 RepID=UPI0035A58CFB
MPQSESLLRRALHLQVGDRARSELRAALRSAEVLLNAHAETLLDHEAFERRSPEEVRIVECSVGDLGLDGGAPLPDVFAAAREHGLALCPADTAPYLRLAMLQQANAPDAVLSAGRSPAGAIKVATPPLTADVEFPKGFYLRAVDGQQWLRGYRCDDEYQFSPDDRFVFRLPDD